MPEDGAVSVDELLKLARDKSIAGRQALADIVSDMILKRRHKLTEREWALVFDILHRMVHDAEMSVRRVISAQIANLPNVPRDLVTTLANDEIEVAYPILTQNRGLLDTDLIEVIHHRTLEHQLAISIRHSVSGPVSDALVKVGDETIIRSLLDNPNAKISRMTMEFLVEESKRVDSFQEPILRREDLDPALAKRMFIWVSAALRFYILDKYQLDQTFVDDVLERSAIEIGGAAAAAASRPSKSEALAAELKAEHDISSDMLLKTLADGQVSLFVALFEKISGLRKVLVRRILFEPGGEGLAIACKATGMNRSHFLSIFKLSRKARPVGSGRPNVLARETRQVMNLYDRMTEEAAKTVTRRWQRDVDYLSAIRELELGG